MNVKHKKRLLLAAAAVVTMVLSGAAAYLLVLPNWNIPDPEQFPVRGVDVSAYQGVIDWTVLSSQDLSFAFIKATEGSSYVDTRFSDNWAGACKTSLKVGAYHFFSYDSSGKTQAENFIRTVPVTPGMLPPVVDIEFYGGNDRDPPAKEKAIPILDDLLIALEAQYHQKPVIYATRRSYERYLSGGYGDYPIWIRSVYWEPRLPDGRDWTFWQYSDRMELEGYQGKEPAIDLNVFAGTKEEFARRF